MARTAAAQEFSSSSTDVFTTQQLLPLAYLKVALYALPRSPPLLHLSGFYVRACRHRLPVAPFLRTTPSTVEPYITYQTTPIGRNHHHRRTMASLLSAERKHKVTIVGSGNWYVNNSEAEHVRFSSVGYCKPRSVHWIVRRKHWRSPLTMGATKTLIATNHGMPPKTLTANRWLTGVPRCPNS